MGELNWLCSTTGISQGRAAPGPMAKPVPGIFIRIKDNSGITANRQRLPGLGLVPPPSTAG